MGSSSSTGQAFFVFSPANVFLRYLFIDRVFFQEEIAECLKFLRDTVDRLGPGVK